MKKIYLNENVASFIAYKVFCEKNNSDNRQDIEKNLAKLSLIIENELSIRQNQCLKLYYYDKQKQLEISKILGITPACVCYHIKKAKQKIYKFLKYNF